MDINQKLKNRYEIINNTIAEINERQYSFRIESSEGYDSAKYILIIYDALGRKIFEYEDNSFTQRTNYLVFLELALTEYKETIPIIRAIKKSLIDAKVSDSFLKK